VREVAEWAIPPEKTLLRREAITVLHEGMARLPERYRAVYVLAEIEGLPHQEIATILELAVGTVKTRLHRARLFLREALAEYFVERRHSSI
jgi:RNA polymerase sigma-70 factor (ECF subfamily)